MRLTPETAAESLERERRRHREQDVRHGWPERDLAHIGVGPRVELRVPEDGMAGDRQSGCLEVVHIELRLRWPLLNPGTAARRTGSRTSSPDRHESSVRLSATCHQGRRSHGTGPSTGIGYR